MPEHTADYTIPAHTADYRQSVFLVIRITVFRLDKDQGLPAGQGPAGSGRVAARFNLQKPDSWYVGPPTTNFCLIHSCPLQASIPCRRTQRITGRDSSNQSYPIASKIRGINNTVLHWKTGFAQGISRNDFYYVHAKCRTA